MSPLRNFAERSKQTLENMTNALPPFPFLDKGQALVRRCLETKLPPCITQQLFVVFVDFPLLRVYKCEIHSITLKLETHYSFKQIYCIYLHQKTCLTLCKHKAMTGTH